MKTTSASCLVILAVCGSHNVGSAQEKHRFTEALASGSISGRASSRSAVFTDPVLYRYVVGELEAPSEGDLSGKDFRGQEQRWERVAADETGSFPSGRLRGGYLYLNYDSPEEIIAILQTNGNSEVYVNGVPRAGDGYGRGWGLLPVKLRNGGNEVWYKASRGRDKSVVLTLPRKPVFLTGVDMTVPDFLTTEIGEKLAAIRIVNATEETLNGLTLVSNVAGKTSNTSVAGTITPLTTRKFPFRLQNVSSGAGSQDVEVRLLRNDRLIDEVTFAIEVKEPSKNYRRTFLSEIDGSVQYYGVRQGRAETGRKPALFLSVHGAGVKAIGQAGSYQAKDWGHVIAPTNRREFGFDWEDWGRLDAMEALTDAEARYGTDPDRTYLTGHSMGGHGAWHLGATYPDRWAAIAPMAGWRSFFSYGRRPSVEQLSPMQAMISRAANPSRTVELSKNYLHHGVFIEHGDNDRSVPVSEARFMRDHLAEFHPDFAYHEEPGGAHWYGVDHQRAFDFFRQHERKDVRDIDVLNFRIASPGISSTCRYITLYQQEESYEFCGVVAEQTIRSRRQRRFDEDVSERTFKIKTENLNIFKVDLLHCKDFENIAIEVDGKVIESLPWPDNDEVWLSKSDGHWQVIDEPQVGQEKNPLRYGGFKDAFRHRMAFVYATKGNDAENAWSYNKARFDAETFYYRGNGSIDVVADDQFNLDDYADRSVILYGNASTNGAWELLLSDSPVQVKRGELIVGDRTLTRDDLGVYMVRPRADSKIASVGVVAGTGEKGARAATPNRYFLAGTGYPDLMVISPEMYRDGADGVVAAGYFGNDWGVETGSIKWNDEHPKAAENGQN